MPFRMRRFEESLSMHTNPTAKENLMAGSETYDTLKTLPQKARWLRGLVARLEDQVDKAVAAEIMEACGRRCIGSSVLEKARRFKQDAHDLDDLLDRLNQAHIGGGKLRRRGTSSALPTSAATAGQSTKHANPSQRYTATVPVAGTRSYSRQSSKNRSRSN